MSRRDRTSSDRRSMEYYQKRQSRINKGAKIMAIVLIVAMVVFYVLAAGLEILG